MLALRQLIVIYRHIHLTSKMTFVCAQKGMRRATGRSGATLFSRKQKGATVRARIRLGLSTCRLLVAAFERNGIIRINLFLERLSGGGKKKLQKK